MMHDLLGKFEKFAMAAITLSVVAGCTISGRAGNNFDPSAVGRVLKAGAANQADVHEALGEPFAKGSAMMPFHDRPHVTWTYFAERSDVDAGSGKMDDQLKYLFVFFDGDRMDSYLWFTSTMQ
jgi:hypothetical protein